MEMRDIPEVTTAPDTYGLPEYKISEMRCEIEGGGHDIRMVFGARRFGQLNWVYTVVYSPVDLLRIARLCQAIAHEALNLEQMIDRRSGGH